jgi:8-oxo-dGTP pyrophosphatase MutT (NUDIX family)
VTEQRYVAHGLVVRTVEDGESTQIAAVRECFEEVGLTTSIKSVISHPENMDTHGRDINFHTLTYLLEEQGELMPVVISQEHDDFRWATIDEALSLPLVWHVRQNLESTRGA